MPSLYIALLFLPAVLIILFFLMVVKSSRNRPVKQHIVLDQVGMLTNFLLVILYVPLSITGFFFGFVGEDFMYSGTPLQLAVFDLIGFLGISTPVAAYGGLIVSAILRKYQLSLKSFLFQFSGVFYLLFLTILSAIPYCL